MENIEEIVKNRRANLSSLDTANARIWLEGFERGLAQAKENLETARGEPFFIVLKQTVPVAETQSQLLFSFLDVIVEEIEDALTQRQIRLEVESVIEHAAFVKRLFPPEPSKEPSKELVLYHQPVSVVEEKPLGMMDGIRQWVASNKIAHLSWSKVADLSKLWKIV